MFYLAKTARQRLDRRWYLLSIALLDLVGSSVSLGPLAEVSSVTHITLVGRFDLVVRHAFRLLIRGGDSPGRVVWEEIFRRARVLLLGLEASVFANSGSV